jgi:CxxC motif-containing protein
MMDSAIGGVFLREELECKVKKEDIFTSIVRIKGPAGLGVVPVKSNRPIDKELWLECSKALSRVRVGVPIEIGDVICKNILNTGVDIVCTRNVYINE